MPANLQNTEGTDSATSSKSYWDSLAVQFGHRLWEAHKLGSSWYQL